MSQRPSLAVSKRPHSPGLHPSSYAKLLLHLSRSLTDQNIADAKLWLAVDDKLEERELQEIKHPGDLFRIMISKNLLPGNSQPLEPLVQLMINLNREDLRQYIEEYGNTVFKDIDQPRCSKIRNIYRYRIAADDDSVSVISSSSSSSSGSKSSGQRQLQPPQLPTFRAPGPLQLPGDQEMMEEFSEGNDLPNMNATLSFSPLTSFATSGPENIICTVAATHRPIPTGTTTSVSNSTVQSPMSPLRASRLHFLPPSPKPSEDVININ